MGCPKRHHDQFAKILRLNHAVIFSESAPNTKLIQNSMFSQLLGNNIYFSAYYVKNTTGGASMETSCEIGLKTADLICNKYTINNARKPIYKTRGYISIITLPFIFLAALPAT